MYMSMYTCAHEQISTCGPSPLSNSFSLSVLPTYTPAQISDPSILVHHHKGVHHALAWEKPVLKVVVIQHRREVELREVGIEELSCGGDIRFGHGTDAYIFMYRSVCVCNIWVCVCQCKIFTAFEKRNYLPLYLPLVVAVGNW